MDCISKSIPNSTFHLQGNLFIFLIEILKANFGWHINQKSVTRKLNVGSEYSTVSRKSYSCMCPSLPPPPLPPKSRVLRRFGLETGRDFLHLSLESGMVFEGTTGVYDRICRFNSKWIRRNASKMRIRNGFPEIFFRVDVLISAFARCAKGV